MDARRFDLLTKRLSSRVSRRSSMRAATAIVLGGLASQNGRLRAAPTPSSFVDQHISITVFPYEHDFQNAGAELKPLLRLMQQQPGFLTMDFITGDGAIYLVTRFLDKVSSDAGLHVLNNWIVSSGQTLIDTTAPDVTGDVFLGSRSDIGCPCSIDDDKPCDADDLVCCLLPDRDRGYCMPASTTCPGSDDSDDNASDEHDAEDPERDNGTTPSGQNGTSSCMGDGCACDPGHDGECDDGLICCTLSNGSGVCMSNCPCGDQGCTCVAGIVDTCDDGLICCAPGEIGGIGTCQYTCSCSGEGCSCITGVEDGCDDDLVCCGIGTSAPGYIGVCLTGCSDSPCPGAEGCECGSVWLCNEGLICCGFVEEGESGICQSEC